MSAGYRMVSWDGLKRRYDLVLAGMVGAFMAAFAGVTLAVNPATTAETMLIRTTAVTALVLLHLILCIGPLARLDRRFLMLHYNRRHLGVTMFVLALVHGLLSTIQFHALGDANPLVSLFTATGGDYFSGDAAHFPFEGFGALALLILFLMAATSHDFWLKNLGPRFWKAMHQGVYIAYALLIAHVALGAMQSERSAVYPVLLGVGFVAVVALHLVAGLREGADRPRAAAEADGFVRVCKVADVVEGAGKVVDAGAGRVALFRHEGRLYASGNVCRHQGGPLGEGRIVDGCITCPWHGWNYKVEDGCSPPPFKEIIPTYRLRVVGDDLYVHPEALPLETRSPGVAVPGDAPAAAEPFFVGYLPSHPAAVVRLARRVSGGVLVAGALAMALIAWGQAPVDEGTFEFGNVQRFEGTLRTSPMPTLTVEAAGAEPIE